MMRPGKKIILEVLISLAICGTLAGGVLFFRSEIVTSGVKLREARHAVDRATASIDRLAGLRKTYSEKAKPYLDVLYNVLPKKDELINLSRDFQTMAQAEALDFGFSFTSETPATEFEPAGVDFSLHLKGRDREGILRFLDRLRASRYSNKVTNASIMVDGLGNANASINGRVFFRP